MSIVKQVLGKELEKFENESGKAGIRRLLMDAVIEKKRRQEEKYALLFQFSVFLLFLLFVFFVCKFSTRIVDYQTIITSLVIISAILLALVFQKLIGLLDHRK